MHYSLKRRIQYLGDGIYVSSGVEEIANIQGLEPAIAVELLIVSVRNCLKFILFRRGQHGFAVSTEV
ncbi:hypothetical protein D3C84_1307140 [compost metagenome]